MIDVPRDVQLEIADVEFPDVTEIERPHLNVETMESIRKAAKLINEAERPVIITGHGVIRSDSETAQNS